MRHEPNDSLDAAGGVTFLGAWFTPNPDDMPGFGQSPLTHQQKWTRVAEQRRGRA
jgi:hypothetical protein